MAPNKADNGSFARLCCSDELCRLIEPFFIFGPILEFHAPSESTSVIAGEGCAKLLPMAPAAQQAVDAVQPPPASCFVGIEFPCFATPEGTTFPSVVGQVFHRA